MGKLKNLSVNYKNSFLLFSCFLLFQLSSCVDPEKPKFEFKEGLIYVDAFASSIIGESYVNLSASGFKFNKFTNNFISGASVNFRNTTTNTVVTLIEENNIYLPPSNFYVSEGESWELLVSLPNGESYQSLPENVKKPIEFSDLKSVYNPELLFMEGINDFIPGHFISIDVNDPDNDTNFYYWRYKSFERIQICEICTNSIFRGGKCDDEAPNPTSFQYVVSYWCDSDCWKIRPNETIKLFSDEFSNGQLINALPVADIPYYASGNILVEIQQYSLSKSAYEYFRVLKDVVENNNGLNAPPPAALIGNMFNTNDANEFVLGRFTAASATKNRLFIDRSNVKESPISPIPITRKEWCDLGCPPQECRDFTCDPVTQAPCTENRFRTGFMPDGWQQ